MSDWKEILYRSYVSSGRITVRGSSAKEQFQPRRAYLTSVIRRFFPADRASRILDVGCGHGALLYFLQEMGYRNSRGVDGSAEQVELARRLGVAGVEVGIGIDFLRRCNNGSADVVCIWDVLEHLTRQEAFDLVSEIRRVLSPGGVCIGHVPNAEGIFGSRVRYGDMTHEQAFTRNSISQMFQALQFENVRCFEDKPIVHGVRSAARRLLWELVSLPFRIVLKVEMGPGGHIVTQNLLFTAKRPLGGMEAIESSP